MSDGVLKNFATDENERSIQDILAKLKFISKIKQDEKMDISSMTLSPNNWPTSLYRTILARGESKEKTLEFIRNVVGDAFDMSLRYLKMKDNFFRDIGFLIIKSLVECKPGIDNLNKTYSDDRMFVSKVEALVQILDTKISNLNRHVKIFKSSRKDGNT